MFCLLPVAIVCGLILKANAVIFTCEQMVWKKVTPDLCLRYYAICVFPHVLFYLHEVVDCDFPPPPSYQKHTSIRNLTYTPFASMFPLRSCIVFLCQLLLFPQWNFFLPPFLNQLFLAFELRFILCTLACSYWLTPGSWLKTSGSAWSWGLRFLSWGRPWGMLAVVPAVYGKFPLLLKGQFGCAQSNSRISRGSFGWPCGLAHSSVLIVQLWLGVAP